MSAKETGGPAFGTVISLDCVRVEMDGSADYEPTVQPGNLTVRDYFAAKAMPQAVALYAQGAEQHGWHEDWHIGVAMDAYRMADAMLKVRES